MAADIIIREARPEDVETIVDIALKSWEPIYAQYREVLGEEMFHILHDDWRERKASSVRDACRPGSGSFAHVAELNKRVVGFITFDVDEASGVGEIDNNAVHPDARGQNLAQRLYATAFEVMRSKGARMALVTVGLDPAHAPARRAYEKAGFQVHLERMTYFRQL
jgi:ribosomal protein S18 acetylase RimI-like enzyme